MYVCVHVFSVCASVCVHLCVLVYRICVCVCASVCIYVYVCACLCIHTSAHRCQRRTLDVLFYHSMLYFLETVLLTQHGARLSPNKAQKSTVQGLGTQLSFLTRIVGTILSSALHAYTKGILIP